MAEPLKVLDELGEEFERLAFSGGEPQRSGRRAPNRRTIILALLLAAGLSGVALAASGLLTGDPVTNPPGVSFAPDRGLGVPVAGSARLSSLRVPDPAGGPPWGLRTLRTSRGYGCVQIGRVVDGEIGVLGQDGAFSNDGRFHPLPADVLSQAHCERPDAAGNVYLAVSYRGLPAGGLRAGCAVENKGALPPGAPAAIARKSKPPLCARDNLRVVYFGLLGRDAESVSYRSGERTVTVPTAGREGAYLVVARPDRTRRADGGYVATVSPGSGLRSVQYRNAPTCRIRTPRALGGAKLCPRVGYVSPARPEVSAADVQARIRARLAGTRLTIAFRARVTGNASSYYTVSVRPARTRGCGFAGMTAPVDRDIGAGQLVTTTIHIPGGCRARLHGVVFFHLAGGEGGPPSMPAAPTPRPGDPVVGRFTIEPR